MRRNWIAAAVFAAGLLATGGLTAEEPKKVTKDQVKEMMIKVHKGDKAAPARVGVEMKKEAPDWEQLAKDAKDLTGMGNLLKLGGSDYTDPKRYISATVALGKAVGDKDKKATTDALAGLNKSCSSCHYGVPK